MIDTDGVPDDANEDDVPDAEQIEDRHDFPDPAFDDVDQSLEDPLPDESGEEDEPELPEPEEPALLEADEQIDPEEYEDVIPPNWTKD